MPNSRFLNTDKDHPVIGEKPLQQFQPWVHHAEPFVMTGEILTLSADHLSQPFQDAGIIHVIVVDPLLIAGVVRRIDIDTLDPALIAWQQGFQRVQIIPVDDHILAAIVLVVLPCLIITVLPLQHPVRHVQVMIDDFIFSDPFKGGHGGFLLLRHRFVQ